MSILSALLTRVAPSLATHHRSMASVRRVALMVALPAGAVLIMPAVAVAQDLGEAMSEVFQQQIQQAVDKALARRVMVTPSLIEVDPQTKKATVVFSNPTRDTLKGTVSIGLGAAPVAGLTAQDAARQAGGLLSKKADSGASTTPGIDSIVPARSLVSWVKGLPTTLQLAPGEKKSVTLTFDIPANLKADDYAAWIVVKTDVAATITSQGASGEASVSLGGEDGKPWSIPSGAKLVYRVKAGSQ